MSGKRWQRLTRGGPRGVIQILTIADEGGGGDKHYVKYAKSFFYILFLRILFYVLFLNRAATVCRNKIHIFVVLAFEPVFHCHHSFLPLPQPCHSPQCCQTPQFHLLVSHLQQIIEQIIKSTKKFIKFKSIQSNYQQIIEPLFQKHVVCTRMLRNWNPTLGDERNAPGEGDQPLVGVLDVEQAGSGLARVRGTRTEIR